MLLFALGGAVGEGEAEQGEGEDADGEADEDHGTTHAGSKVVDLWPDWLRQRQLCVPAFEFSDPGQAAAFIEQA
jgi:hypothetical protein